MYIGSCFGLVLRQDVSYLHLFYALWAVFSIYKKRYLKTYEDCIL